MITDTVFTDDIALISDNLDKAPITAGASWICSPRVGLYINSSNTEYMAYNLRRQGDLTTLDYAKLRQVAPRQIKRRKTSRTGKQKHGPLATN